MPLGGGREEPGEGDCSGDPGHREDEELEPAFGEWCLGSRRREGVGAVWLPEARAFPPFLGKGENRMKPKPRVGEHRLGEPCFCLSLLASCAPARGSSFLHCGRKGLAAWQPTGLDESAAVPHSWCEPRGRPWVEAEAEAAAGHLHG